MTFMIEPMGSQHCKGLVVGRTAIQAKERIPVLDDFSATLKTGTQFACLNPIASIVRELNTIGREETGCPSELTELVLD